MRNAEKSSKHIFYRDILDQRDPIRYFSQKNLSNYIQMPVQSSVTVGVSIGKRLYYYYRGSTANNKVVQGSRLPISMFQDLQ